MLIFRYLAKEIFIALASLTTILLLIFMSNQLVLYLNRAASGQIPGMLIMKLMMLELPTLMSLLLPLGFYVSLLIGYGRLYADSEMTVLQGCGYGSSQLLKHSFIMAFVVAAFVMIIMMWASPIIANDRARLLQTTGVQTLIKTILPGRFRALSRDRNVFYVESMNRDHTVAKNIFFARLIKKEGKEEWDVLWADKASALTDKETLEDYVILRNGKKYQGVPGHADYQIAEFERYQSRLPHPNLTVKNDIRTVSTADLWPLNNPDFSKAAELQWRIAIPLMVLTLTLVGVPLSCVNSRVGKFAKLLPAIILFIIYANVMFITRNWITAGKISIGLGWCPHLVVALFGILLIWRNHVKLS